MQLVLIGFTARPHCSQFYSNYVFAVIFGQKNPDANSLALWNYINELHCLQWNAWQRQ